MAWGTSSDSSSSRLGISSTLKGLKPVRLPPGRARLATRPAATGSLMPSEDDRDRRGRNFRGQCRTEIAACHDQIDLAADEIGGQCGQPIIAAFRPAVLDRHVLSLDIAGFAQSLAERGHQGRKRTGRRAAEETDHRERLLLRADQERIRRRAGENHHEIPASHTKPTDPSWAWIMALQSHFRKAGRMATFHPSEPSGSHRAMAGMGHGLPPPTPV